MCLVGGYGEPLTVDLEVGLSAAYHKSLAGQLGLPGKRRCVVAMVPMERDLPTGKGRHRPCHGSRQAGGFSRLRIMVPGSLERPNEEACDQDYRKSWRRHQREAL